MVTLLQKVLKMSNIFYLVIFLIGSEGVTSQSIPQANLKQCQINAKIFNESQLMPNTYLNSVKTNKAYCIAGVK